MDFTNKPRLYDSSLWDLFGGGEESPRVPEAMAVNLCIIWLEKCVLSDICAWRRA